ncbi:MAG: signal peptide peptidase SppA [Bacteroidota bacterium]|nr:signal peptide peptidase SppA [Bacteroidota bacterium]
MKFLKVLTASTLGALLAFGILFFFGFLLLLALAAAGDAQPPVRPGSVLTVDLSGAIPEQVSGDPLTQSLLNEPAFDLQDLETALAEAATDDRIEALWLRPFNITESWATLEAVRRALEGFKESGKPVIASGKNFYMGEAEYFLASVADSIYLDPESIFEFNGFAITPMFYAGLFDKLDVEPIVIRAGDYKGAVEPYTRRSFSSENREQLQAYIDNVESLFVQTIADARGMRPDDVENIMDNDVLFSSINALEAGLVDDLLFSDEVADRLRTILGIDEEEDLTTVSLAAYQRQVRRSSSGDRIAVVHVDGNIMAGSSDAGSPLSAGGMAGSDTIVKAIRTARERRGVQAMVIRINSPGGVAPAADAMLREVKRTAEDMPVIISMGGMAASGGYLIATGGKYIIAESTTLTGSIGVFMMTFDLSGPLENELGLSFDTIESGPSADMFSGFREWTAAERASMQRFTDYTYQQFLAKVAEARGLTLERAHELGAGRVWTGTDAFVNGLVDEIGGFDLAVQRAAEEAGLDPEAVSLVSYPTAPTLLEQFGMTSAAAIQAVRMWTGFATQPATTTLLVQRELAFDGQVQARFPFELSIR